MHPAQEGKPMSKQMEGKNKPKLDNINDKEVIEYFEPHPDEKGDSIRVNVDSKTGDTSRYQNSRVRPNSLYNHWEKIE